MKYGVRALVIALVAFTALGMAYDWIRGSVVTYVGPFPLYIFDILLLAAVGVFFYVVGLRLRTDPSAANRLVLRLTGLYLAYQLLVVLPIAVVFFNVGPGDVYQNMKGRLGLALIPFFYYVALRYLSPPRLVAIVNVAAVALLLYALYRYVFVGPQGIYEYGEYRLRLLWGGATLLFGWLAVSGLLLERKALYAYGMGLGGVLGVVLVNHRSGYVALLLAFVAYIVLSRRLTARAVAITTAVLVGGLLLTASSATIRQNATYSLSTMFNANADISAQDRVVRSALAWDYVKVHPLGDYVWQRTYYLVDLGNEGFEPHNFVIQALDKQGWVSASLLFAIIVSILALGWRTRRRSPIGNAMTVYLVFYLAFCLFNTNFDDVQNITLFAIAAALILDMNRVHVSAPDDGTSKAGLDDTGTSSVPGERDAPATPGAGVSTPRAS